jgi:hypothetical protein
MRKRFISSTVALVLGVVALGSGLSSRDYGTLISGLIIILGSLAYKSRKKRLLGLAPTSRIRVALEIGALIAICGLILFQRDLADQLYTEPFQNIIIPGWALVAYALAGIRAHRSTVVSAKYK